MSSKPRSPESSASERGSAVAEYALVATLLLLIATAIFQLGIALHARNTVIDSAGEGARHAALRGSSLSSGVSHTRALIAQTLPASYSVRVSGAYGELEGLQIVEITVVAPVPVIGFLGPATITSAGRAVVE